MLEEFFKILVIINQLRTWFSQFSSQYTSSEKVWKGQSSAKAKANGRVPGERERGDPSGPWWHSVLSRKDWFLREQKKPPPTALASGRTLCSRVLKPLGGLISWPTLTLHGFLPGRGGGQVTCLCLLYLWGTIKSWLWDNVVLSLLCVCVWCDTTQCFIGVCTSSLGWPRCVTHTCGHSLTRSTVLQ